MFDCSMFRVRLKIYIGKVQENTYDILMSIVRNKRTSFDYPTCAGIDLGALSQKTFSCDSASAAQNSVYN